MASTVAPDVAASDAAACRQLLRDFRARAGAPAEVRWSLLEAAHIVGQNDWRLHLRTHAAMLGLALQTRDGREALGQLLRLALVPAGHVFARLPSGNPGRSTVRAFIAMPMDLASRQAIAEARVRVAARSEAQAGARVAARRAGRAG